MKNTGITDSLFSKKRIPLLFLFLLFLAGVLAGAVSHSFLSAEVQEKLSGDFLSFFTNLGQVSLAGFLKNIFQNHLQLILLAVLFTLTLTGALLLPVLSVYSGFLYGLTLGLILGEFGVSGIFFNILYFLPRLFLFIPSFLLFLTNCFSLSSEMFSRVFGRKKGQGNPALLRPEMASAVFSLILVLATAFISAVAEAYLSRFIVISIFH